MSTLIVFLLLLISGCFGLLAVNAPAIAIVILWAIFVIAETIKVVRKAKGGEKIPSVAEATELAARWASVVTT